MSSEEDVFDGESENDKLNRQLLVQLVKKYPVVLNTSQTPSCNASKDKAWLAILEEFSLDSDKPVTLPQLKKLLNNLKTGLKRKRNKNVAGDKNIYLKPWEKELLNLLIDNQKQWEEFAELKNIQTSLHAPKKSSNSKKTDILTKAAKCITEEENGTEELVQVNKKKRKSKNLFCGYETEETKDLSTAELERVLLLQQIHLNKIKIEKEQIELERLKQMYTVESTYTEDG